jgi:flagellin-like hook-associated protein FlgL
MKKIIICVLTIQAQKIVQLQLSQSTNNPIISLLIENNVYFNVTTDGSVVEWGIDFGQGRMYYYPGKLDKYMGRVEYYSATDNESLKGKVKYVGATAITYYTKSENDFLAGKIKSIGNAQVNYFQAFDEDAVKGKIKSVGQTNLTYFANFDNEAFKGKLKSVGNTNITYYASFDDKAFKGKLKSIGTFNFVYYSSFETRIAGALKSGFQTKLIDGINFIVR